jgi:hypothetical protein
VAAIPSPERLRGSDLGRFVALAGGVGLVVDAALVAMNGSSAISSAAPVPEGTVDLLAAVGAIAALAALASGGRSLWRSAARSAPEMYPFGPAGLQLGLYLLLIVGAAAISHALLVAYTGTDSSGAAATPNGSLPGDALLASGSLVLWLLALYAVYGLRRFIQMGRTLDARRGVDPFRSEPPGAPSAEPVWVPSRGPARPRLAGAGVALAAVTGVVMVAVTVGIQLLETPIGPVPPTVFWWSQVLTLATAAVVVATVRMIDRGVRDIERQYAGTDAPFPVDAAPAATGPSQGFVP